MGLIITVNRQNSLVLVGSSLYKAFPPQEANRIWKRLEVHYTPKHGSWLDIAEIEPNVPTRQCLNRRIAILDELEKELASWEKEHNMCASKVNWQLRTNEAKVKLASLYPALDQ